MRLDRWLALVLLLFFAAYGYAAWFSMDDLLPPILRRNPVWPSSFPKLLAVLGTLAALAVIVNLEGSKGEPGKQDLDYRRWRDYKVVQAALLLALMLAYALLLRPLGFVIATTLFSELRQLSIGRAPLVAGSRHSCDRRVRALVFGAGSAGYLSAPLAGLVRLTLVAHA